MLQVCLLLLASNKHPPGAQAPLGPSGGLGLVPPPSVGRELHPSTSALTHAYLVQSCRFYKMGCVVLTHNDEQI